MLVVDLGTGMVIITIIANCMFLLVFFLHDFFFPSFSFFWEFNKCVCRSRVEMDVLWGRCSVPCRMYKGGKEVVRE